MKLRALAPPTSAVCRHAWRPRIQQERLASGLVDAQEILWSWLIPFAGTPPPESWKESVHAPFFPCELGSQGFASMTREVWEGL